MPNEESVVFINSSDSNDDTPNIKKRDDDITFDNQDTFVDDYKKLGRSQTIDTTIIVDGSEEDKRVLGFSFPRCEIMKALDTSSDNIGIHFSFGYNKTEKKGITIILYGIKSDGAIVKSEGKMFDYSKPCPDNCPKGTGKFISFKLPNC